MTAAAAQPPSETLANSGGSPPAGWQELRGDATIQFAPVKIPDIPPRELSWFERALADFFEWLASLFSPVGSALGGSWSWLQWVVLGVVALAAAVLVARLIAARSGRGGAGKAAEAAAANDWRPDAAASLALLEDADRLAAEGRFDEATHLLLQRSVSHIAAARPDWVEPSSTARELAALPALPDAARAAFRVITERVERSLFALSPLARADWEAARAAYAEVALARIGGQAA